MILQGRNLIIKVGGVAIAAAKACSINVQAEQIPVSSPTSGEWEEYDNGRKKWSVSTNQLMTTIRTPATMVGTTVSLSLCIEGQGDLPFVGFVSNPTLQSGTLNRPDIICWDKTRKKFLALWLASLSEYYFYETWEGNSAYTNIQDFTTFIDNGSSNREVYTYLNGDLYAEKLTGNANVETWQADGAIGSLAKGSFQFRGTGPLTPASLPSS